MSRRRKASVATTNETADHEEAKATSETGEIRSPSPASEPPPEPIAEEGDDEMGVLPGLDADGGPGLEKTTPAIQDQAELRSVIESLVFVADRPVTDRQLAKRTRAKLADVQHALSSLLDDYATRGIELAEVAGGWIFRSATRNAAYVRDLVAPKPVRLSRAQIETLAIVAYRQPVTRPEVDDIRGVDSGFALKLLADRDLIKILGRKDEPGRPLLYGTSEHFLEFFGMRSLTDLPTLQEFAELSDESRALFERSMGEPIDLKSVEAQAQAAEAAAQAEMLDPEEEPPMVSDEESPTEREELEVEIRAAVPEEEGPGDEDKEKEEDEDDDDWDDDDEDDEDEDDEDEDDEDEDDEDEDDEDEDDEDEDDEDEDDEDEE